MMKHRVKKVEQVLRERGIEFETASDDLSARILTPNCTIELFKNQITVNEQPTTLDEFIYEVLAVETTA